jgi:RNA-binding protein YlmH
MYVIQKNINRLRNGTYTFFLDPKEQMEMISHLKKNEYNIYKPYKDSEKKIFYKDKYPEVILYEIKIKKEVRHQDILGSIYGLNIDGGLFGDVLIIDNHYYVYILSMLRNYFESNFLMVGNSYIELEELDVDTFKDYERSYKELEFIVSSERIDTIISSIIHSSRSKINDLIKNRNIMLNYDYLKDSSYKLKEGDTFSIKRIGKFKYMGIKNNTKSNHLVVKIYKYI